MAITAATTATTVTVFFFCYSKKKKRKASRTYQIMPTRMSNTGQGIHLGINTHHTSTSIPRRTRVRKCGAPCSGEIEVVGCDVESVVGYEGGEGVMGVSVLWGLMITLGGRGERDEPFFER